MNIEQVAARLTATIETNGNMNDWDGFSNGRNWAADHATLCQLQAIDTILRPHLRTIMIGDLGADDDDSPMGAANELEKTACLTEAIGTEAGKAFWAAAKIDDEQRAALGFISRFVDGAMDVYYRVKDRF